MVNINSMVNTINICFPSNSSDASFKRLIKWNNNNFTSVILNADFSCLGSPIRAGYGGILWNSARFYLSGFSGYIRNSSDILHAELYAIYHGLLLAKDLEINDIVCYSNSMHYVNLIKSHSRKFHVYAVLIQDIKDLLELTNVTVCHTLRKGNQCADFMAKLEATSDVDLSLHHSPPESLSNPLQADAAGTFFFSLEISFFFLFCLVAFLSLFLLAL